MRCCSTSRTGPADRCFETWPPPPSAPRRTGSGIRARPGIARRARTVPRAPHCTSERRGRAGRHRGLRTLRRMRQRSVDHARALRDPRRGCGGTTPADRRLDASRRHVRGRGAAPAADSRTGAGRPRCARGLRAVAVPGGAAVAPRRRRRRSLAGYAQRAPPCARAAQRCRIRAIVPTMLAVRSCCRKSTRPCRSTTTSSNLLRWAPTSWRRCASTRTNARRR